MNESSDKREAAWAQSGYEIMTQKTMDVTRGVLHREVE